MDPIARMVAAGAAGVSGSSATYVDDVFSTYLYDGTGSAQTITNGIDLSGEGGLVWIKRRGPSSDDHLLYDTERNTSTFYPIRSNSDDGEWSALSGLFTGFNSDGFSIGNTTNPKINASDSTYVSWNFRKAPGFFDVVTYTGDGVQGREISHSLGSVPGMIIVKRTDSSRWWAVYHRSLGATKYLRLNENLSESTSNQLWSNIEPTSSVFTVHDDASVNISGASYVAYLFAHDDQSFGTNSDESIIKCGQFEAIAGTEVNLGFEPQWVLIKRIDGARDWFLIDNMREMSGSPTINSQYLSSNDTDEEKSNRNIFSTSTGFIVADSTAFNNDTHIYMAIRRPNKPPEDGTDVFAIDTSDATSPSPPQFTSGFVTDFIIRKTMNGANAQIGSRLQGTNYMSPYSTSQQSSATALTWDFMDGWSNSSGVNTNLFCYMFKRAPGFFDVVAYKGTGSTTAHNHNLGVTPELLIVKNRYHPLGYTFLGWPVYNSADGASEVMLLNADDASDIGNSWAHTAPTSTTFTTGTGAALNSSGATYVAYLFASLAGISKVGTYTGTGSAINVDCGFTAGARFVMIKRRDSTGGWYVWDSTNGIVSGNDPYWIMNDPSDSGAVTNTDYIDPLNAGFTVTASGQGDINASGGTYLFLAIA